MGDSRQDMVGFKSGKLEVVAYASTIGKRAMWLCLCGCGNAKVVMGKYLRKLEVKSCGCLNRTSFKRSKSKFYLKKDTKIVNDLSSTYKLWLHILRKCYDINHPKYKFYGGKGIIVAKRWFVYDNFLNDVGEKQVEKTIVRNDSSKDYSKDNCKWAVAREHKYCEITFNNETHNIKEWANKLGINPVTLSAGLSSGLAIENAFDPAYFKPKKMELQKCASCKLEKHISEFVKNKNLFSGIHSYCKDCNSLKGREHYSTHKEQKAKTAKEWRKNNKGKSNFYSKTYQAKKRNQIPQWADLNKIKEIYKQCQEYNKLFPEQAPWHVDHITPLQGETVCGFHVEYNLQIIPAKENLAKGRKLI